jgi:cytochrome b involved in lipid metabolism
VLGLRPLTEYCQTRLGAVAQGVAVRRYQDVVAANSSGSLWLILDSMVLDVKAWLPEHPGGASIIPRQSLDADCARFFEVGRPCLD